MPLAFDLERAAANALGRAAEKQHRLPVFVEGVELAAMTVPELAELLPERALLAVLEGPGDKLGVMALCPDLLAAMIEMQAIGRVTSRPAQSRKPTRTDATISADFVNALLAELGQEMRSGAGHPAFGAYRYATYIDDPRPLALMLEDGDMLRLSLRFRVGSGGQRDASILIALPAEGGLPIRPQPGPVDKISALPPANASPDSPVVPGTLAAAARQVPVRVVGILCRRKLSLQALRALAPGSLIPLPQNVLDDARVETEQGQFLARGRLGEADGFHAIRLRHASPAEQSRAQAGTGAQPPDSAAAPAPVQFGNQPLPAFGAKDPAPPIADLNQPDAFRQAATADMDGPGNSVGQIPEGNALPG